MGVFGGDGGEVESGAVEQLSNGGGGRETVAEVVEVAKKKKKKKNAADDDNDKDDTSSSIEIEAKILFHLRVRLVNRRVDLSLARGASGNVARGALGSGGDGSRGAEGERVHTWNFEKKICCGKKRRRLGK